jgi:hypothetical protein
VAEAHQRTDEALVLFRQAPKLRAWWDTRKAAQTEWSPRVARILLPIWYPQPDVIPANDRDHIPW